MLEFEFSVCLLCARNWFGLVPSTVGFGFLDGFIMQFQEESVIVYFKEGEKKIRYPYWWNFSPPPNR
jgi:hypothetical protein